MTYSYEHDKETGLFKLILSQETSSGNPLHIPISVGLLNKDTFEEITTEILHLKEPTQTFEISSGNGIDVVPSILREFSAPVKLVPDSAKLSDEEVLLNLAFLAAHDTDGTYTTIRLLLALILSDISES